MRHVNVVCLYVTESDLFDSLVPQQTLNVER